MSRMYSFDKENLLHLVSASHIYIHKKFKKMMQSGEIKPGEFSVEICDEIAEEFLEMTLKNSEIKIESILDELDEILKKVGIEEGVTEFGKKIKKNTN